MDRIINLDYMGDAFSTCTSIMARKNYINYENCNVYWRNLVNFTKMLSVAFKHSIFSKVLLCKIQSIQGITQRYFKHDKNIFSAGLAVRSILTKCTRPSDRLIRTSFLKSKCLPQNSSIRHQQTLNLDINTNVRNNVILYKYDDYKLFRNVRIFMFGQLFGWSILAFFTYRSSFLDIFKTDIDLKQYWKNNFLCLISFGLSIILGPSMCLMLYALHSRIIKYIILNKGGKTLTLVTHHFLKKKSTINLSVESVKCCAHRTDLGMYMPLKVKNRWFYFLIEKNGTFVNPTLFDYVL
ncbi:hypothetical protein HN011_000451 [Eciton burchellii]|nr:hypothetical protein HN011_000451 [Eciton burchellii]